MRSRSEQAILAAGPEFKQVHIAQHLKLLPDFVANVFVSRVQPRAVRFECVGVEAELRRGQRAKRSKRSSKNAPIPRPRSMKEAPRTARDAGFNGEGRRDSTDAVKVCTDSLKDCSSIEWVLTALLLTAYPPSVCEYTLE